jgi:uncharacterized protein
MAFEWDAAKRTANLIKNGIDFRDAVRIFEGPVLEKTDRRREYREERIAAVGITMGLELYVVYTVRGAKRRIISARRANRDEREAYRLACAHQR